MAGEDIPVRIVFTASKTWFGRAIRWITRSRVSHVFLEFPIWGQRFAAESTVSGTRIVPLYKAKHNVESEFQCKFPTKKGILVLSEKLGAPYDWSGTFFLGVLIIVGRWFKFKWRSLHWSTKALKCSELVAFFLRECDVIAPGIDIEMTTPEDLRVLCATMAHNFERLQ